ncbi:hypothetical protein [Actinomadura livida]|uniref:DUF1273 family protein n=1 Tax=Actinomadura livida TaxID=79909 RepID=A0A7W7IHM7_9ACTN|nr:MULTISPECIES: hypothetical protein [Actinomadura]MBB4777180.1 hypothetical protein [Actinomadura catellatispora]GGU21084.1 hypothetical protein GCM10010208_52660 [Actinomadura livida]
MRIAITGHRDLDEPTTVMVDEAIRTELRAQSTRDIVGVSCLAAGADQIFARAVLHLGGRLEVVIPATGYAAALGGRARRGFEELKARASRIRALPHVLPGPGPYRDAGLTMLDRVDRLIAVWDGAPARGGGGTAEVVEYARRRGVAVHVIWPEGARRTGGSGQRFQGS